MLTNTLQVQIPQVKQKQNTNSKEARKQTEAR